MRLRNIVLNIVCVSVYICVSDFMVCFLTHIYIYLCLKRNSAHNSQICPSLMTLITLFYFLNHSEHNHYYASYQFNYVIFYLVFLLLLLLPFLLSNFYFFVHVCASDLHPKSSSIIERQSNYDSILLFCMFFFLFTYYKLNNSTTDYLLSDLQSCSTKQSVHNTTLNGAFHPFFASFTLSFFCNCRYNLKRKKNMFSFFSLSTNQSMNVNIRLYIYVRWSIDVHIWSHHYMSDESLFEGLVCGLVASIVCYCYCYCLCLRWKVVCIAQVQCLNYIKKKKTDA